MKTVRIERPVIEWKYKALFGTTKTIWALAPIQWEVRDPKNSQGVSRRAARRQARK